MDESKINEFYKIIKESDEFDEEYYISNHPEVLENNINPIIHFITEGAKKLYNPSNNFSTIFYLYNYKDLLTHLKKVGFDNFNPLVHYINYGKKEGRLTKSNFDLVRSSGNINNDIEVIIDYINICQKEIETYNNQLNSINELINIIFSNYDFKAKGILRLEQIVTLKLLKIFDVFCQKYNLKYWIDYGTLLGGVRHGGYIPWDDDIDIGMMRSDFYKFLDIFPKEIAKYSKLNDLIDLNYHALNENWKPAQDFLLMFCQVIFKKPLVKFDIFIYDFVEDDVVDSNYQNFYKVTKRSFINDVKKGRSPDEAITKYNSILKVTDKKGKLVISSVDSFPDCITHPTSDIFPLKMVKFEDYLLPCPNNPKEFLKVRYGPNFMSIPNVIRDHKRVDVINKQFSSEEEVEIALKKTDIYLENIINEINNSF